MILSKIVNVVYIVLSILGLKVLSILGLYCTYGFHIADELHINK